MVSLRSPGKIQPRISRRVGEDLGSGHDLGQVESDHRLAPFHQGGNDDPRSPLVAPKTTIRPKVARQRKFFSGMSPSTISRMTFALATGGLADSWGSATVSNHSGKNATNVSRLLPLFVRRPSHVIS
jgi:hypothetical protein